MVTHSPPLRCLCQARPESASFTALHRDLLFIAITVVTIFVLLAPWTLCRCPLVTSVYVLLLPSTLVEPAAMRVAVVVMNCSMCRNGPLSSGGVLILLIVRTVCSPVIAAISSHASPCCSHVLAMLRATSVSVSVGCAEMVPLISARFDVENRVHWLGQSPSSLPSRSLDV